MARRIEQAPGRRARPVARPDIRAPQRGRTARGRRPHASAGVMPMSRTATAMQNGIELVKLDPGLQSLASATVTPASMSRRASGYGWRVENSTPGSRSRRCRIPASAATSASLR